MRSLEVIRVEGEAQRKVQELLTEEVALKLYSGERRIATILCSPSDLEDLVRGFLFSLGVIERAAHLKGLVVNRATWSGFLELDPQLSEDLPVLSGVVGSGCGSLPPPELRASPPPLSDEGLQVPASRISALMAELARRSEVHQRTGGVHSAALADAQGIRIFREDIGRHNAVDKVIGRGLAEGVDFGRCLLLSSGRISSELLYKAVLCRAPVLVSRAAPTDRSVELARSFNLTLAGFARGQRMNLYSAAQRILTGG
jgi:FdhD protein